ncbi:MAG: cadherin-like domain-containing protein, partial [Fibrobacter sp.]|nr:cadherin-like domain-containing protein [Fibrobacter sp.]
ATIKLDQFARDKDHRFDELKWTFTGNKFLRINHDRVRNELKVAQPYEHWNGAPETITFTVTDPEGASATTKAKFTVISVNDAPVAVSQAYQTKEGDVLEVNATNGLMAGAKDPDNEKPIEAMLVSKPQNGSVKINSRDGSFSYKPNKGFYGLDEFTFKLKDKGGLYSKVETAEINVSFKMKDVRKAEEVKKEEPAPAAEKKKTTKSKKKKRRK